VALYGSMIRKGVYGVGELLKRVNYTSRLVAIIPQKEERMVVSNANEIISNASGNDRTEQVTPPGFIITPLPFEDDVRTIPPPSRDCIMCENDEWLPLRRAAKDLIKRQEMEGIEWGYSFDNPSLRRFWGYLESVALGGGGLFHSTIADNDNGEDDFGNEIGISESMVLEHAGEQIEAFLNALPQDDEYNGNKVAVGGSMKRKLLDKWLGDDGDITDWISLYKSGEMAACCRNDDLKGYLRRFGLKISGNKVELLERVSNHIESCIRDGILISSDEKNDYGVVGAVLKTECDV